MTSFDSIFHMSASAKENLRINPVNGHLYFGSFEIMPETTTADLGNDFAICEEISASVVGKKVKCRFAKTTFENDGKIFALSLRFENQVLVSAFININDPSIPVNTAEEFYESLPAIKALHEQWLEENLGDSSNVKTAFDWGKVGVAQDKSDNIYIYLHNRNNIWAFT